MVQQDQKGTKPQGSFYVPAKLVHYDLPSIVEDENEMNRLIALWKVDESFHSKLKDVDHPSLYNAFVDQLDHDENPIVFRTPEAEEIIAALRSRADFEVLQKQRFERCVPWIEKSSRESILRQINEGIGRTKACLFLFRKHSTEVPKLYHKLRRIRNYDIDISVPEVNIIPMDTE